MIGEAMRLIRMIKGVKAKTMAAQLEISASYLSLIENGKKQPSIDILKKFASVVGVKLSQIMYFSEELTSAISMESRACSTPVSATIPTRSRSSP